MHARRLPLIPLLILAVSGCPATLHPRPPNIPPGPPLPDAETSSILAPLSVDLTPVRDAAQAQLNQTQLDYTGAWDVVDVGAPVKICLKWRADKNPIGLSVNSSSVTLSEASHIYVEARPRLGNTCNTPGGVSCDAPVTVSITGNFGFGAPWQLAASLHRNPVLVGDCKLSFANWNANGHIADLISPKIDEIVNSANQTIQPYLNVRPRGQDAWNWMSAPIKITDSLWLVVTPSEVDISQPTSQGNIVLLGAGFKARPTLAYTQQEPSVGPTRPLPDWNVVPPGDSFHLSVDGTLDYDTASAALAQRLVGRRYPFQNKWVEIASARAYGVENKIILEIGVADSIKGTLYLVGTPQYDSLTNNVTISGLDYDIDTKNLLVKLADWLLHERFQDALAQEAHWNLTQSLDSVRTRIVSALNNTYGKLTLSGQMAGLSVVGFHASAENLLIRARLDGTLHVNVAP